MIKTLIKGLGKYTVESGIIYFKSLLRGSILYAAEAMVNLKEKDIKLIEKSEEATLRDLVKTECSAPRHLLYLELGIIPARYVIKQRKIMFLKHILMQSKNSLIRKVFNAQVKTPSKGDWTSEIRNILKDLKIHHTFEEIESISKKKLSIIVKNAVHKHAFEYLVAIQKQKQKGRSIEYSCFELQPYFRSYENISLTTQREIFALRIQMNHIQANFCSSSQVQNCEKCKLALDNYHLFQCTRKNTNNIKYEDVLNGNILEQKNAIKFLHEGEN
jgi:hypothetical protein